MVLFYVWRYAYLSLYYLGVGFTLYSLFLRGGGDIDLRKSIVRLCVSCIQGRYCIGFLLWWCALFWMGFGLWCVYFILCFFIL